MQQLFAFAAGNAWNAGAGQGWWRALDGSIDAWLDASEVAAAQLCTRFAPMPVHAQTLAQRVGLSPSQAQALLDRLVLRRLMIAADDIVPAPTPALPIIADPIIAIRTYRRAQQLRGLLDSARADEQRYAVRRRYLVIDDGDDDADARSNRALVDGFRRDGTNIGYFGPDARAAAIARLCGADGDRVLAGALSVEGARTPTGARAWNWAVLLAAGGSLSFVDDDCQFPIRQPEKTHRIWSLQHALANEGRFYDGAVPQLPIPDEDPYALMRGIVGQPVGHLWHRDGVASNHFAGRTQSDFAAWGAPRRVLAASTGVYGGHVYDSSVYFSITDAASRADLLRRPFALERLEGDRLWQGVSAARMTLAAVYTPLLLDDRELLPFAGTHGKADDTGFFALLSAIEPDAAYAYLPLLMGHFPGGGRRRLENARQELLLDANHYLGYAAQRSALALHGRGRAARLAALGVLGADLLSADARELEQDVQSWRGRNIAAVLAGLDEARREAAADAPPEWLAFLAEIERTNRAAMEQRISAVRLASCKEAMAQLVRLAPVWPELWLRMQAGLGAELLHECGLRAS